MVPFRGQGGSARSHRATAACRGGARRTAARGHPRGPRCAARGRVPERDRGGLRPARAAHRGAAPLRGRADVHDRREVRRAHGPLRARQRHRARGGHGAPRAPDGGSCPVELRRTAGQGRCGAARALCPVRAPACARIFLCADSEVGSTPSSPNPARSSPEKQIASHLVQMDVMAGDGGGTAPATSATGSTSSATWMTTRRRLPSDRQSSDLIPRRGTRGSSG